MEKMCSLVGLVWSRVVLLLVYSRHFLLFYTGLCNACAWLVAYLQRGVRSCVVPCVCCYYVSKRAVYPRPAVSLAGQA